MGDTGERRADRASRLSIALRRLATWGLVVLCTFFVLDEPVAGRAPVVATDPEHPSAEKPARGEAVRPAITAAIVSHLRDRRSSLSEAEQARVIEAVLRSSRRHGLDPFLVTAVLLVESDARPWAESGKGAIGLMQVMPYMAAGLPLAGNLATIESNVEAGCYILADNIRRLGEAEGISSYFWGRRIQDLAYLEKVQKALARVRLASAS